MDVTNFLFVRNLRRGGGKKEHGRPEARSQEPDEESIQEGNENRMNKMMIVLLLVLHLKSVGSIFNQMVFRWTF